MDALQKGREVRLGKVSFIAGSRCGSAISVYVTESRCKQKGGVKKCVEVWYLPFVWLS